MKVIRAYPPFYNEIEARLHPEPNTIFAWGDTIFNPSGGYVSPALRMHEAVHGLRQGQDIAGWWHRYIDDPTFRLAEEIPAHRVEYRTFCRKHKNWNRRAEMLEIIAARLAGPLYGELITLESARSEILRYDKSEDGYENL